ncbi:MAG: elongation factor G [Ilumatobacter sp.]|uniref:elongation factor G n=1 Tax=Ilumatobacter sp. TaxID=1967498 RepID=UPI002607AE34|nr:elongation factor G [Ilumatobacter sp.]MDJ0771545.1 elongation factor G [Ilumatobacter sp.]
MQDDLAGRIRNVALVGHGGVGKTTLAEALLHAAQVTTRAGSVDEGTTLLDHDPEEVARGSSVSLGIGSFGWRASDGHDYQVNLLDTPGHPDFEADVDAALAVADLAVLVVSAADGIEVGTETAWRKCAGLGLPRLVFVTREDKQRANFEQVVADLTAAFGSGFTPIELPIGEQAEFHGVVDLITEQSHEYDADGRHHVEPLPVDMAEHAHEVHDQVVEEIVAGDDEQLERYLEGDVPPAEDLERTLAAEVLAQIEFPVLVGSGSTGVGVDRLADYICEVGPSPADRPVRAVAGEQELEIAADPDGDPLLYVFKTISDRYVGQVSVFKVVSGTLLPDMTLREVASGDDERLHGLFRLCGTEQTQASKLVAGDIGAVTKLTSTSTGSTLAPPNQPVVIPPVPLPTAHLAIALVPVSQSDDDKLSEALQRLVQEDPSLVIGHDELSRRTVLRGVGDAHLAVAISRLEARYGVHVESEEVRVPYRRTIRKAVEAAGRVKKQSGGHGQFAAVDLRVSPLERGAGFEFVDKIVGGAIPKQYVAAVQHGVEDAMTSGAGSGIPIVDVRVECIDGKTHSVDSSDMAFKTAAALGFADAVEQGDPVLLEPVSRLVVRVPVNQQGEVLGDLSSRRGNVIASDANGDGDQVITATVPTAEVSRYAMDLRAMTGGRGSFTIQHDHHDPVPDHLVGKVLAEYES